MSDVTALLQPMKDRLTDHAEGPWAHYVSPPEDQAKLIAAVEAVDALATYWEQTPALRKGTAAKELRAALTQALGGDTA